LCDWGYWSDWYAKPWGRGGGGIDGEKDRSSLEERVSGDSKPGGFIELQLEVT
jgi:hypothetical protein